ncbi:MAG: flagellar biosynthetic protein FliO [Rhodospirillales bacterium]|nr:flagellar biosynthetic protein FliO [Rhodospirillales bacterium]
MSDWGLLLRLIVALAIVLALIAAATWVARRYVAGGALGALGGKRRRLAILEMLAVDSRSRLLLVRRDDAEHLLLVGPAGALLVETGIRPPPDFAGELAAGGGNPPAARPPQGTA